MRKFLPVLGILLVVIINTLIWWVCLQRGWVTSLENGGMENAQVIGLVLSGLLFALTAIRQRSLERVFFLALAFFCMSFVLRELDTQDFGLGPTLTFLTSGIGRNVLIIVLGLAFILYFLSRLRETWALFMGWAKTPAAQAMFLAGIFLVISRLFDQHIFPIDKAVSRSIDELLELNGYFLILISSLMDFWRAYVPAKKSSIIRREGFAKRIFGRVVFLPQKKSKKVSHFRHHHRDAKP
jgi:hypothetical protein